MSVKLARQDLLASGSFIGGYWRSEAADSINVTNPATQRVIAILPDHGAAECREAIAQAQAALADWQAWTAKDRAGVLRAWHDLVLAHQDDLARILTAEQGKPLAEAVAEIRYGASYIEWFAEEAKRIDGDIIPPPSRDKQVLIFKQPVGVVAAITPWNFPSAMICRKVAPALAAGCTVVCKPAIETPLSALALCALGKEAGVPDGVLNVVVGANAPAMGDVLTSHPHVRKLTFTGSTRVGKRLMAACAATGKRTSMELGGNAPFIVFDDADIEVAVRAALVSKFRNAGQTCVCSNRFLVHSAVYDEFVARLCEAVAELRMGDGTHHGVTLGPLISQQAANNVQQMVTEALADGASLVAGGSTSALGACFHEPTILVNVKPEMRVFREEIFGPVLPIVRFEAEAEAVALANDTESGLAAYFFTRELGRIFRVGAALEYGMVGVNEGVISNEMAPFGGVKESGHGREGSKYGIADYLELKSMCIAI